MGGHSLGGVVAGKLAAGGGFSALLFHASYADDPDAPKLQLPKAIIAGRLDCSAKLATVAEESAKLPARLVVATVDGLTHHQFTSDVQPDVSRGCLPDLSLDAAHATITEVSAAFLQDVSSGQGLGEKAMRAVPGVEVETR